MNMAHTTATPMVDIATGRYLHIDGRLHNVRQYFGTTRYAAKAMMKFDAGVGDDERAKTKGYPMNKKDKDLRMNKFNRRRLETLERRHDYLRDRVEADPGLKFDAAECAALHWAIRVLRKLLAEGL